MSRMLAYQGRGVQTFLSGLLSGIQQIDSNHEFFLFVDPSQTQSMSVYQNRFSIIPVKPKTRGMIGRLYWDHISVGLACKRNKIDALFAPAHVRPMYAPCAVVVAILDMMYHLFPQSWDWFDQTYFRLAVSTLTIKADRILAISNNTRKDILDFLPVKEEWVDVIYPGVSDRFMMHEKSSTRCILDKYQIENSFILYTGSLHPRKNVKCLIEAFEAIAAEIPHDLVLVGPPTWKDHQLFEYLKQSKYSDRVKTLGYVPDPDLPAFYNGAALFVHPSLYEGFGLPVLEALACGCPVITSQVSSLPEVGGEAAYYFNPNSPDELAAAMRDVLDDSDLRSKMSERGLLQASKFSWKNSAAQTIRLLEEAAGSRNVLRR